MNKLVKGAIAGTAGIVLLMGGAGTLAYWTGSADAATGTSINAGQLKVGTVATSTGTWKNGATTVTPSTFRVVPGDTLTFTQDLRISASGDNLRFQVALSGGAIVAGTPASAANTALANALTKSASFSVAGSNVTPVAGQADTYKVATAGDTTVTVSVSITWPFGDGSTVAAHNSAQLGQVALGVQAITVQQVS